MKKLLLIGLMLICVNTFAQQSTNAKARAEAKTKALSHVNAALLKKGIPVSHNRRNVDNGGLPINNNASRKLVTPTIQSTANEATIGNTNYDLQTNNTISNRIVNNSDGTISAVWTFSPDANTGYPLRGTGYNYFDGSVWQAIPTSRIEVGEGNVRSGFTNIGVTSTGQEAVIAHGIQVSGPSLGMLFTTRPTKGSGGWDVDDTILGHEPADTIDLWPKMVTGGADGKTIHAIWRGGSVANQIDGQAGPIFYSRSTDNGVTWSVLESINPLINSAFYLGFSADEYSIDARGSVVAIVANTLGADVVLLKSTDNGNTWTKTLVDSFPIPLFDGTTMTTDTNGDGIADTLWSGTGDANLVIDNNNEVHVFFSAVRTVCVTAGTAAGDGLTYFPFTSELFYWNESMGANSSVFIAYAPDLLGHGDSLIWPVTSACPSDPFPFGNYGIATRVIEMPSAGVDSSNNIYVCYQATDELSSDTSVWSNKLHKHPFLIKSMDGGTTWTPFDAAYDIVRGTRQEIGDADLQEGVFASMAKHVDSKIHIIYQRDGAPGTSLAATSTCDYSNNIINTSNDIIYVGVDTALSVVGIHELPGKSNGLVLSSNFPNPASSFTQFNITLNSASNIKLDVTDMLGQNVYSENKGKLSAGIHTVTLNTSYLSSGVYFYTVTAGEEKATGKMIVR